MFRKGIIVGLFSFITSLMEKIKNASKSWNQYVENLKEAEMRRRKAEKKHLETEGNQRETERKLSEIQKKLESFSFGNIFEPAQYEQEEFGRELPSMATTEEQVKSLLSMKYLNGPYGLNLLKLKDIESLLFLSSNGKNLKNVFHDNRIKKIQQRIEYIRSQLIAHMERLNKLGIEDIAELTLIKHPLPKLFQGKIDVIYEADSRIILVVLKIPDLSSVSIMKQKGTKYRYDWVGVADRVQKKLKEDILYSLCIRAGYLVANSDTNNNLDLITINARQSWFDPATGTPKEGIIASLQSSKSDFLSLQIDRIEPKACFRHLKGISTPSVENIAAIKPIFDLDMNDRRIIENKQVSESLDPNANLAAMPWDDFEHLVRQLFEWEFGNKGIEVKVTCASRDRGVDAIMFDPDPLKGGKYVLQAKRYNRTVDVAAVRDLYGTVVNEGANRGILVTTSSYGPDTYEFAKGKPISLIDGQHLVQMLTKHGKNYHVKLER